MALEFESQILSGRTMGEWHMVVSNIVKEMNLILVQEKACCNGMDWRIAPSLIEESAIFVK